MCGNPRRNGWDTGREALTLQERRQLDAELPERHWKRARQGPKPYAIEERRLAPEGGRCRGLLGNWGIFSTRRYRTEAARDTALKTLRRKVRRYPNGNPMWEYRAADEGS
jgi:hypothetical protein